MSERHLRQAVLALGALLLGAAGLLWWQFGTQVFFASLSGWLCA